MTADQQTVFVIPQRELPSLGSLFLLSSFWGFLVLIVALLLAIASGSPNIGITITPELAIIAMIAIAIPWPLWRLRQRYRTIVTTPRAAWLGFGYALGILGLPAGMIVAIAITESKIDRGQYEELCVLLLFIPVVIVFVTIAWLIIRLTLPKFVLQNGTLCPNCAHCILGVQSMRCPECGNAFTFEQLETTQEEFNARTQAITST